MSITIITTMSNIFNPIIIIISIGSSDTVKRLH